MSIVRFGLYFIPEDGPFYSAGSSVVGYDVRSNKPVQQMDFIDPNWTTISKTYGFHATITDAIYIDEEKLAEIETVTTDLLGCLSPSSRYTFTVSGIGFWHDNSNQAAVHLVPNRAIELLHDLLVSTIHPLGLGSEYTDRYEDNPAEYFADSPSQIKKTQLFHAPYIFDDFTPHFTCINPFKGSPAQRTALEANLAKHFGDVKEIEMSKIALVVKSSSDPHFSIRKEFSLH